MRHVLDTSVLVEFLRGGIAAETASFLRNRSPDLWLSSVVFGELLEGARGDADEREIRAFFQPQTRAGRVFAPSPGDLEIAGAALGRLRMREHVDARGAQWLLCDALLAASSRRIGAAVLTRNRSDFERVARYIPVVLESGR